MCGSFALSATTKSVEKLVPNLKTLVELSPRTNIFPSQEVAILRNGSFTIEYAKWGLVPSWAKDTSLGAKMFNARAETIDEKPSFRNSFKSKRSLIFADAFYEWKAVEGLKKKVKFIIKLKSGEPFTFAGLYDLWNNAGSQLLTTTIITSEANELMAKVHHRMPVILPSNRREVWLDDSMVDTKFLKSLLVPLGNEEIEIINSETGEFVEL